MSANLTREIHCKTAEEFLDVISERGPLFRTFREPSWVFRGVRDYDFELVPSAIRREATSLLPLTEYNCKTNASQIKAEIRVIEQFYKYADASGLPLPEDSQELRSSIEEMHSSAFMQDLASGKQVWPPDPLLSLIGLAQHFELPTRLLDWSRHAFIAAYFAASGAVKHPNPNSKLCVWAYSLPAYELDALVGKFFNGRRPVRLVTTPAASNRNLAAQQGVFTVYRPRGFDPETHVDRRPLDAILDETMKPLNPSDERELAVFIRFGLPHNEAAPLLWLLSKEGFDAAKLFPGFGGVAQAIKEAPAWGGIAPIPRYGEEDPRLYLTV